MTVQGVVASITATNKAAEDHVSLVSSIAVNLQAVVAKYRAKSGDHGWTYSCIGWRNSGPYMMVPQHTDLLTLQDSLQECLPEYGVMVTES